MGLSKRLCEKIYLEYSKNKSNIFFIIVRFGNVVGSKGSVIPYFQDLIEKRLEYDATKKGKKIKKKTAKKKKPKKKADKNKDEEK